jgi:hypothetical protein
MAIDGRLFAEFLWFPVIAIEGRERCGLTWKFEKKGGRRGRRKHLRREE